MPSSPCTGTSHLIAELVHEGFRCSSAITSQVTPQREEGGKKKKSVD